MRNRHKHILFALGAFFMCFLMAGTALALPQLPDTPMRVGAEGEHVLALQQGLLELKLYSGKASGVYDDATAAAVAKLQTMLELKADGICSPETIKAYNTALLNGTLPPAAAPQERDEAPALPLAGKVIGLDPGHQLEADEDPEPIGPAAKATKPRMSEGALGAKTGIPEHETTMLIAKKIKRALEDAGATVIMTRTKHDVSLSNAERAELMNKAKVDCWIRIHCDFSTNRKQQGVRILAPSGEYTKPISDSSLSLAKALLPAICAETGAKQLSISKKSDQTGFNYSKNPVVTIEFGYLSNPSEDVLLNRDYYQQLCANGVRSGLVEYFSQAGAKDAA